VVPYDAAGGIVEIRDRNLRLPDGAAAQDQRLAHAGGPVVWPAIGIRKFLILQTRRVDVPSEGSFRSPLQHVA
jgi:hypothetical protein